MNLEKFQRMQEDIERLKEEGAHAKGARDALKEQILTEFDCKSIKQAKKKLKQLQKEEDNLEKEFSDAYETFTERWGPYLDED